MAFQPAPFTAQVTMVFALPNGASGVNVYHCMHGDEGWTEIELESLVSMFRQWWVSEVRSGVSNECALTRVEAKDISAAVAPFTVDDLLPPMAGSVASPMLPANVSCVVSHSTGLTGRSSRGRTYMLGLPESLVSGNYVTQGLANDYNNAFEQLLVDLRNASTPLAVLSRFTDGLPRAAALAIPIVASYLRDNRIDTQRRRLPRVYGT